MKRLNHYAGLINSGMKGFLITLLVNLIFPALRNVTNGTLSLIVLILWVVVNILILREFRRHKLHPRYFLFGLIAPVLIVFGIVAFIH